MFARGAFVARASSETPQVTKVVSAAFTMVRPAFAALVWLMFARGAFVARASSETPQVTKVISAAFTVIFHFVFLLVDCL